jgi:hypothetical protein
MSKAKLLPLFLILSFSVHAHQPVMDMAPRWDDGYGFQIRHENYGSKKLMNGDSEIVNPLNQEISINKTWFEGVYTFDKSIRITAKLPYIKKSIITNNNGAALKQSSEGFGDFILGVPLKHYVNGSNYTSNLSLTPSVRFPTGSSSGDFPISDGSTDFGLSLAYSRSTSKFYQLYDLFYWMNNKGERGMNDGDEIGLDINVGFHPIHRNYDNSGMFILWDITLRQQTQGASLNGNINGGKRIHSGPILILYRNNIMFRAEYKLPIYENFEGTSLSRGNELNIGIGITF